ncbi:hypothetical protein [Pectobacterium aroidearum]|uniref:hypothetical protein n=1 Tax=Pectobacterium aroidearum TaxID=1201031 RepID=UPI0032EBFC13
MKSYDNTQLSNAELDGILSGSVEGVYPTTHETLMARELISLRAQLAELEKQEPADFRWRYRADNHSGASAWTYLTCDRAEDFIKQITKKDKCVEYGYVFSRPVPPAAVTAEHQRVIGLLIGVCGAAFELADDTCQQEVDGEPCHVVPENSFSRLSDWLDEIANTLPDQYDDLPSTVLQWGAVPRHALRSLLQSAQKDGEA